MISPSLGMMVVRAVPPELVFSVLTGQNKVTGSVIRSVTNGRIIGHLQETAGLAGIHPLLGVAKLAADGVGLINDVVIMKKVDDVQSGVNTIIDGVANLQESMEVVKTGVEAVQSGLQVVQGLGLMNLAMGAAGIGVSAVGFAVISAKIDGVKRAVEDVSAKIDVVSAKIDQLSYDAIAIELAEVRGLAKSYDEAWLLSADSAEKRWQQIGHELHRLQAHFEVRADRALMSDAARYEYVDPLMDALGMIGCLRVSSLMACNEAQAARAAAQDNARVIERITGGIGLRDLARPAFVEPKAGPGSAGWLIAEAQANQKARPVIEKIRQREEAAHTRAAPLEDLEQISMRPREWLEAARNETDQPLLYLPSAA